ncbi:hypothetical protein JCM8097_004392 [Rhodosporidiobolus ruineniae]
MPAVDRSRKNVLLAAATALLASSCLLDGAAASPAPARTLSRRWIDADGLGFADPAGRSSEIKGQWLTTAQNVFPPGVGEPLNVVLSANSDAFVKTLDGLVDYMRTVPLVKTCTDEQDGESEKANLGDGSGGKLPLATFASPPTAGENGADCLPLNTTAEGLVVRAWQQTGTDANTGAYFLAASYRAGGKVIDNGYDLARTNFTRFATLNSTSPSSRVFSTTLLSTYTPSPSENLANVSRPVNASDDSMEGRPLDQGRTDGEIAVLEVQVVSNGTAGSNGASSFAGTGNSPLFLAAALLPLLGFSTFW